MNKEEPFRDQAERLRKRVQKLEDEQQENNINVEEGLPPRSQIHRQKKKKTKVRLKYPIIRLLALFFILLPIVIYSMNMINKNEQEQAAKISEQNDDSSVERVQVEDDETDNVEEEPEPIVEEEEELAHDEGITDEKENSDVEEPLVEEEQGQENTSKDTTPMTEISEKDQPKAQFLYHKVQLNETLYRISMKYYRSPAGIERIRKANGIKGNEILVGQTLKIPVQ